MSAKGDARGVALPFIIFTLIWGSTWIVIRDQIGTNSAIVVPAQWSVAYRFLIASAAMFAVAKWNGERRKCVMTAFVMKLLSPTVQVASGFEVGSTAVPVGF